uniref:cob n=1 Tax=Pentapycnon charcoti TaxID=373304 RepID=UPI00226CC09F|nr:cob [Pentapycnon charcoti]UZA61220.1 cytochrome b [Pentapycnon charcoti]
MLKPMRKTKLNEINNMMIDLPSPINISIMWKFGSMLSLSLMIQIMTGLFLTMHYCPEVTKAFMSISHISRDVNYGWLMRTIHMNGASMFFMMMYIHIGRGLYYKSFKMKMVWMTGMMIFILSMTTAFMGYVLPWGQMSFWGTTVITNLFSAIPYIGNLMVEWLWGGFSVNNATLNRFFTLHFMLPFIIMFMVMMHLISLHKMGSNNPMGMNSNMEKIMLHPFFSMKDMMLMIMIINIFIMMNLYIPMMMNDPENFIKANPMITPIHIQPEWYFLFAYTILRSIPNKLGGVISLMMSIIIIMLLPMFTKSKTTSNLTKPLSKIMFWMLVSNFILLTWAGTKPVEMPYETVSLMLTMIYFMIIMIMVLYNNFKY